RAEIARNILSELDDPVDTDSLRRAGSKEHKQAAPVRTQLLTNLFCFANRIKCTAHNTPFLNSLTVDGALRWINNFLRRRVRPIEHQQVEPIDFLQSLTGDPLKVAIHAYGRLNHSPDLSFSFGPESDCSLTFFLQV